LVQKSDSGVFSPGGGVIWDAVEEKEDVIVSIDINACRRRVLLELYVGE
jgi:hypothetical protein